MEPSILERIAAHIAKRVEACERGIAVGDHTDFWIASELETILEMIEDYKKERSQVNYTEYHVENYKRSAALEIGLNEHTAEGYELAALVLENGVFTVVFIRTPLWHTATSEEVTAVGLAIEASNHPATPIW